MEEGREGDEGSDKLSQRVSESEKSKTKLRQRPMWVGSWVVVFWKGGLGVVKQQENCHIKLRISQVPCNAFSKGGSLFVSR